MIKSYKVTLEFLVQTDEPEISKPALEEMIHIMSEMLLEETTSQAEPKSDLHFTHLSTKVEEV